MTVHFYQTAVSPRCAFYTVTRSPPFVRAENKRAYIIIIKRIRPKSQVTIVPLWDLFQRDPEVCRPEPFLGFRMDFSAVCVSFSNLLTKKRLLYKVSLVIAAPAQDSPDQFLLGKSQIGKGHGRCV